MKDVPHWNGTTRALTHDTAGQVVEIAENFPGSGENRPVLAYSALGYDAAGRITNEFTAPIPSPYIEPSLTMVYNQDNQVTNVNGLTIQFDPDGNMLGPVMNGGALGSYAYDARNRRVSAGPPASVYQAVFTPPNSVWGAASNCFGPLNLKLGDGSALVQGAVLSTNVRNNFSGWVGMAIEVGPSPIVVTELGRWVVSGNSSNHVVKLTDWLWNDLPNGTTTVGTAGKPANQFAYASLPGPVTLQANTKYLLISQEVSGGDTWLDYNSLLSVGSPGATTYGYDPEGNRTKVVVNGQTNRFAVNPNAALSQVLVRTKADGSKTFYNYGQGLLYEVNETASGTETSALTYHYDLRGSTVALTDQSGVVRARYEYSPYGQVTKSTYDWYAPDTPFLYNGRYGVQTDPNGLCHMRARYYNPYIKRFINADPIGMAGGLTGMLMRMAIPFRCWIRWVCLRVTTAGRRGLRKTCTKPLDRDRLCSIVRKV